jgi:hypothetical protein
MSLTDWSFLVENHESGRRSLNGHDLHCGDCFQIKTMEGIIEVRIEHNSNGWYLVGIAHPLDLDNRMARFHP